MTRLIFGVFVCVGLTAPVWAQTPTPVTAASGISFGPSADHGGLNADGTPILNHYEWRFQPGAGCLPIPAVNIGKPMPVSGTILVKPVPGFGTLTENCNYTGVIAAVGPTGLEGVSVASDPFVRFGPPKVPAAPSKPGVQP